MKGAPMPSGEWNGRTLERFDKFSQSPISAWEVRDGTLGSFISETKAHNVFSSGLRDLGTYGVSSATTAANPAWKYAPPATSARRLPKGMRQGIAGGELGPTYMK